MKRTEPRLDKHGFPIPPDFDSAGVERPGGRRNEFPTQDGFPPRGEGGDSGGRRSYGFLKLLVIVGVLAALAVHFDFAAKFRLAVGQYHAQQAINRVRVQDWDGAIAEVNQALSWNPNSGALLFLRAQLHHEKADYQASLTDVEQVLAIKPNDEQAQRLRSGLYYRLRRHREAAAAATEMIERRIGDSADNLNSRAYSRAVGDFELEGALDDIDQALRDRPENASFIDTRGYVLFKLGRNQEALDELNRAIALTEKEREEFERRFAKNLVAEAKEEYDRRHKLFDEHLAVMYHHRGEVHEKLGNADEAKKDRFIGVKLGYDPETGVY